MTSEQSKLEILKKVEDGTLSVEEGSRLIGILDGEIKDEPESVEKNEDTVEIFEKSLPEDQMVKTEVSGCWKAGWSMILWLGAGLTALSGYWMYTGYLRAGLSWGFWLSWIPLLIGIVITIIGILLLQGRWLNVKIKSEKEGKYTDLNISIPLPLNFVSWVFKNFDHVMPAEVREKHVGEMLEAMETSIHADEPFHVVVDDDEDGEHVEVTIC